MLEYGQAYLEQNAAVIEEMEREMSPAAAKLAKIMAEEEMREDEE